MMADPAPAADAQSPEEKAMADKLMEELKASGVDVDALMKEEAGGKPPEAKKDKKPKKEEKPKEESKPEPKKEEPKTVEPAPSSEAAPPPASPPPATEPVLPATRAADPDIAVLAKAVADNINHSNEYWTLYLPIRPTLIISGITLLGIGALLLLSHGR